MNKLSKLIILLFAISITACSKDAADSHKSKNEPLYVDFKGHNETLKYYQNIAKMAKWYAENPAIVMQYNDDAETRSGSQNELENTNTVIEKLQSLCIESPDGKTLSFFDLDEEQMSSFLEEMPKMEADDLSKKIDKLNGSEARNEALKYYENLNKAFNKGFENAEINNSTKSGKDIQDPYFFIRKEIENIRPPQISPKTRADSDTYVAEAKFWTKVFDNSFFVIVFAKQPSLDVAVFFNRIKKSLRKGRLLISLPEGFNTTAPIVKYTKSKTLDFGHVAVISKDKEEAEMEFKRYHSNTDKEKINLFSISIGTNKDKGMREEHLMEDWSNLHATTYVGQIYDVKYKFWWRNIFRWGWKRIEQDVNNYTIYKKAVESIGTPYCNAFQVLTAKWAAPERMICSSSAWWYAKNGAGVNIGDWWKPTIFPAGVFLSDRVRIIDSTID